MRALTVVRLAVGLLAAAGVARAAEGPQVISEVTFEDQGSAVLMTVTGERKLAWTAFPMAEPPRFVIDFSLAVFPKAPEKFARNDGAVEQVQLLGYGSGPYSIARILLTLVPGARSPQDVVKVSSEGTRLLVRIEKATGSPAPAVAPPPPPPPTPKAPVPLGEAGPDAIAAAVRAGADVNAPDASGRPPLSRAVYAALNFDAGADRGLALHRVRALLEAGADPNRPGRYGLLPLDVVAISRLPDAEEGGGGDEEPERGLISRSEAKRHRRLLIEALLAGGADPASPAGDGIPPAVRAWCHGDDEVSALFSKGPRRAAPVTPQAVLALSSGLADLRARVFLDECVLARLERAGASPAERYAVATRPTLIPGIGRQKVFELAAADPAIASRARKDPALAEARKDPRVRVTLGIDSLLAPATVRRVLAAAGPIGGRECGDLRDEPSMHFQEDGRVRTSEPCADQGMVDGDGPAVLCDVEGTYVASRGAVVISLPGRNPMGPLAVEVSGYAVSVGGLTNEAPPCGERIP